jgi:hypothetical protein
MIYRHKIIHYCCQTDMPQTGGLVDGLDATAAIGLSLWRLSSCRCRHAAVRRAVLCFPGLSLARLSRKVVPLAIPSSPPSISHVVSNTTTTPRRSTTAPTPPPLLSPSSRIYPVSVRVCCCRRRAVLARLASLPAHAVLSRAPASSQNRTTPHTSHCRLFPLHTSCQTAHSRSLLPSSPLAVNNTTTH